MIWIVTAAAVVAIALAVWQGRRLALARRAARQRPRPKFLRQRPVDEDDDRPAVNVHGYMLDPVFLDERPWVHQLAMTSATREEFYAGITQALWVFEGGVTMQVPGKPERLAIVRRGEWTDLDEDEREAMYSPEMIDELRGTKDRVIGV